MSTASPSADRPQVPFRLAGLPLSSWAYATRIWAAMMLALCAAFWLQLDNPGSAAVTVAILAQPRRGEAFRKAGFRFAATVIGVAASILLAALFPQQRDLYIFAFAGWMALAVYVATMYDGTRAYGAVLSGYTVAIVAVTQIDDPTNVFSNGMARLAVVSLGIASIALINDVFAAPTVYPNVRQRLRQAQERTLGLVRSVVRGEPWRPAEVVDLLAALTGTRLDILAVSAEGPSGGVRSRAAASAVVAMVNAISKIRALAMLSQNLPQAETALWREAVTADDPAGLETALDAAMTGPQRSPARVTCLSLAVNLIAALRLVDQELAAMEAGREAQRRVAMPIHRDRELAKLAAGRVFLVLVVSGFVFVLSSWPMTSSAWSLVGVLAGLSATVPDARAFAKGAMRAFPVAFAIAGITEYIILDGADAFPLLMIGYAPAIFCSCFLFLNPKTSPVGFLLLVFTLVMFSPSNPQNYSEETYLYGGLLDMAGAFLFSILLFCFFPVSDKDRRRWMVNRARTDLLQAMAGRAAHGPDEMAYLTADRIVALSRFQIGMPSARLWRLRYTLLLSNLTLVAGRGNAALDEIARAGAPREAIEAGRNALCQLEPPLLREAAARLIEAVPADFWGRRRAAIMAVADLAIAARLTEENHSSLSHLRHVLAR